MPEGPEVRIIVNQLNKLIKNKKLLAVKINSGKYSRKSPNGFNNFAEHLPLKVKEVKCQGKFIYFIFENDFYLLNSLRMTGGWKVKKEKHSHFDFVFSDLTIYFTDMRNFGTLEFTQGPNLLQKQLTSLGPDIFTKEYTENYVHEILTTKKLQKKTIVQVIMDQNYFCGIGNYLKSEILYECLISPHRLLKDLTPIEIKNIYHISKKISRDSYEDGGGSAGDFSDLESKKGNYKFKMKVYAQKLDPHGNKIKKEKTKDTRTTHWVPEIQK